MQPLDACCNKPFKDQMLSLYNPWLIAQSESQNKAIITKAGYLRAPSNDLILEWIKKSRINMNSEVIINSFSKTGITNNEIRKEILE